MVHSNRMGHFFMPLPFRRVGILFGDSVGEHG
jgi:hypothetical protein